MSIPKGLIHVGQEVLSYGLGAHLLTSPRLNFAQALLFSATTVLLTQCLAIGFNSETGQTIETKITEWVEEHVGQKYTEMAIAAVRISLFVVTFLTMYKCMLAIAGSELGMSLARATFLAVAPIPVKYALSKISLPHFDLLSSFLFMGL